MGYKWNTTNNFSTAIDMDSITEKIENSLTCDSIYTRYVWAYSGCSQSTALTMTQSTLACWSCGQELNINHVAGNVAPVSKTTTYGTVTNVPGDETKCWITKNLGADIQAATKEDSSETAAGWYWQFNQMQGYKHDGTNITPNNSWNNAIDENSNWTNLNDPCTIELGSGWRLPTLTEWTNVDAVGSWINYTDTYASILKLHTAGNLYSTSGTLQNRTGNSFAKGYYWSGTQNNDQYSSVLTFTSAVSNVSAWVKSYGFSVRCIR
jgi:hypothetical protein